MAFSFLLVVVQEEGGLEIYHLQMYPSYSFAENLKLMHFGVNGQLLMFSHSKFQKTGNAIKILYE